MNNFLTVEDANTLIYDNQDYWWYEIDLGKISSSNEDFTDVKYDFCEISRKEENPQSVYRYKITVKVHNSLWTGGQRFNNRGAGGYANNSIENGFVIYINNPDIKIYLYMGTTSRNAYCMLQKLLDNYFSLNLKELASPQIVRFIPPEYEGSIPPHTKSVLLEKGYNLIKGDLDLDVGYLFVNLLKTNFQFNCTQNLVVGRVNKVRLGADIDYLPDGDFVGEYTPIIRVEYNNKELPVSFDETLNDYVFNLDLSDVNTPKKIRFKVNVETNDVLNESSTLVVLDADYEVISSYDSLVTACGNGGASSIRLGAGITLTSSIIVTHSIKILGDNNTLNLNSEGFVIKEDITFKAENTIFDNGNIAIKQSKNSSVELTGCTFNNCTGFGSCITCDIDYDSLSIEDDYTTILNDCLFTNNNLCIVHSGELTINGCKYHNTDTDYIDKENVAFLYQFDGEANIKNSIFDIDYDTDSLCSNEENIGFAQALLQCGVTAKINGANANDLKQKDNLPFTSNASHIFAKYYYPQLETCIYTSPILGKEDQAVCYCVSNENWIYKQNVQVTRADSQNENRHRTIIWEN